MIAPMPAAPTCATAWLSAAQHLASVGEAYNIVVDVDDPVHHSAADTALIVEVDKFLRARKASPIVTVANTIFPQDLYRRSSRKRLSVEYEKRYDSIRKKGWGRYFERMIRWPIGDGSVINQIEQLIDRLRKQLSARQTDRNVYELTLFDPVRDKNRNRNRQCLSFLSFKMHPQRGLMLTALYRNHHYVARALGNFIGLSQLMFFVAREAGTNVGPLTCVSTHAELDSATGQWTKQDAKDLVARLGRARTAGAEPAAG